MTSDRVILLNPIYIYIWWWLRAVYRQQNRCKIESPVHHLDTWERFYFYLWANWFPGQKVARVENFGNRFFHWDQRKTTSFPGRKNESISSQTPKRSGWRIPTNKNSGGVGDNDHVYPELCGLQFLKGERNRSTTNFLSKAYDFWLYAMIHVTPFLSRSRKC